MQAKRLCKFRTVVSEVSSFAGNPVLRFRYVVYLYIYIYNLFICLDETSVYIIEWFSWDWSSTHEKMEYKMYR